MHTTNLQGNYHNYSHYYFIFKLLHKLCHFGCIYLSSLPSHHILYPFIYYTSIIDQFLNCKTEYPFISHFPKYQSLPFILLKYLSGFHPFLSPEALCQAEKRRAVEYRLKVQHSFNLKLTPSSGVIPIVTIS